MLLGVVSDSHDRLPALAAAIALFQHRGVDAVLHAGDFVAPFAARALLRWTGPLHVIYGNNDGERPGLRAVLPQIQDGPLWLELGRRRLLMHHFIDWCVQADRDRADIIISGHTHETVNERAGRQLFLNPGECCGWLTGRCTAAILDTDGPSAEIVELAVSG